MRHKIGAVLLALLLAFGGLTACGEAEGVAPNGEVEDGEEGDD